MKAAIKVPFRSKLQAVFAFYGGRLALLVLTVLLSSCCPTEGLLPFSLCLIGVRSSRQSSIIAALGSLAAALIREVSLFSFTVYCIPVILYLFLMELLRAKDRLTLPWRCACLVLSGVIGMLSCPRLLPYDIIMCWLSLGAGCALLPILDTVADGSSKDRSALTRSEIICIFALACAVVISLPGISVLGIRLDHAVILTLASLMALALPDGLATAFTGICVLMLAIKKEPTDGLITLIICSVLAGGLKRMGRFSAIAGFTLADIIASLCLRSGGLIIPPQTIALASVAALTLNKDRLYSLKGLGGSVMVASASQKRLASRCVAQTAQRLRRNASVFDNLCTIFRESSASKRVRRAELCSGAASRICSRCDTYDYCWKMRYSDTYSDFKELAGMIAVAGSISPYDVSDEFKSRCKDWIGVLLDMNNANAAPEQSLPDRGNAMMARQCKSIADMLYGMANQTVSAQYDNGAEERITSTLCQSGYVADDVVCALGDRGEISISVALRGCRGDKPCASALPRLINDAIGIPVSLCSRTCSLSGGGCLCTFEPIPRLKAVCHAACKVKDGQSVCGDSFSLLELPGGKYLAAISDGMGSGAEAARESENAMALLETVCLGQMEINTAYQTVNELLQLRKRSDEAFSTMDACIIDLFKGVCSWGKIGAAPGYVMRSGRVQAVEGNSLPLGVVSSIEPSISQRTVKEGDILVLVSDGVYDALVDMHSDGISDLLPVLKDKDARSIASELVRSAIKKNGGARDDMTAIAIKITAA